MSTPTDGAELELPPSTVTDLAPLPDAREVPVVSLLRGSDYICPACKGTIPTRKQIRLAKPAEFEQALNDVQKCPFCNFIFSPKVQIALVVSQ